MTIKTKPLSAISVPAARLSFVAAALSLVLLASLHFLEPEFNPSWRMVSEYANGHYGWVQQLVFLSLALGCVAMFTAIRSQVQTKGGKFGLGLLLVVAAALTAAAFNAIDPITATKDQLTTHGNIHGMASLVGVFGLVAAQVLISVGLRRNPAWTSARQSLLWVANFTWVSLVLMILAVGITLPLHHGFGPGVWIGWPNRLVMLAYAVWFMVVVLQAIKLHKKKA